MIADSSEAFFRIVSVDLGMPTIQLLHKNFPAAQIEHNFRLVR